MLGTVKASLAAFGLLILGIIMPIHIKRIVLVTTLHLQLVREGVFHDETLHKLNMVMGLAKWDDALLFPASMYEKVWDREKLAKAIQEAMAGRTASGPLTAEELQSASERLVELSPKCLRYGRRADMLNDMIRLFNSQMQQNQVLNAA